MFGYAKIKPLQGGISMIFVKDLTMTYPSGKGIFDLNFTIEKGVVTGYLGPNGLVRQQQYVPFLVS